MKLFQRFSSKSQLSLDQVRQNIGRQSINSLKIGIVGMANIGKSSTFNILSKQSIPAENFPFCTIDPNHAILEVPDFRYSKFKQIHIFKVSKAMQQIQLKVRFMIQQKDPQKPFKLQILLVQSKGLVKEQDLEMNS